MTALGWVWFGQYIVILAIGGVLLIVGWHLHDMWRIAAQRRADRRRLADERRWQSARKVTSGARR